MRIKEQDLDMRITKFLYRKASQFPEVFKDFKAVRKDKPPKPRKIRLAYS